MNKISKNIYNVVMVIISMILLLFVMKKQLKRSIGEFLEQQTPSTQKQIDILYVLGGSFRSTYYHLEKTAIMNRSNSIGKIMALHTDETPMDNKNKRYKDQWIINRLEKNGVSPTVVEFLYTKSKNFGTLSESIAFKEYLKDKAIKTVMIVTSKHHTRRAGLCFRHFLEPLHIQVYVTGSEHQFDLTQMIIELFKYCIYKYVLLNLYT